MLADLFAKAVQAYPDRIAVRQPANEPLAVTFDELDRRAEQIAQLLASNGASGSVVGPLFAPMRAPRVQAANATSSSVVRRVVFSSDARRAPLCVGAGPCHISCALEL